MPLLGSQIPRMQALGSLDSNLLIMSRFESFDLITGGAYSQGVDSQEDHTPGE